MYCFLKIVYILNVQEIGNNEILILYSFSNVGLIQTKFSIRTVLSSLPNSPLISMKSTSWNMGWGLRNDTRGSAERRGVDENCQLVWIQSLACNFCSEIKQRPVLRPSGMNCKSDFDLEAWYFYLIFLDFLACIRMVVINAEFLFIGRLLEQLGVSAL